MRSNKASRRDSEGNGARLWAVAVLAAVLALPRPGVAGSVEGFAAGPAGSPGPTTLLAAPAGPGGAPGPLALAPAAATDPLPPGLDLATRPFAPRWSAAWSLDSGGTLARPGLAPAHEFSFVDRRLADASTRSRWRHFVGFEFAPAANWAMVGGVAKSHDPDGLKLLPVGYERLRLNLGARWRSEGWGLDGSFSFIPAGPSRVPGDAGYVPGSAGSTGATWMFGFSLSRRF